MKFPNEVPSQVASFGNSFLITFFNYGSTTTNIGFSSLSGCSQSAKYLFSKMALGLKAASSGMSSVLAG